MKNGARYYIVDRESLGYLGDERGSTSLNDVNELLLGIDPEDADNLVVLRAIELKITRKVTVGVDDE